MNNVKAATNGLLTVMRGILTWNATERRSNRYGSIHTADTNFNQDVTADQEYDLLRLRKLRHQRVRITCEVVETRASGHCGDRFLGIMPTTPNVGDVIELGVGTLDYVDGLDGMPDIILKPRDGRKQFWIDPHLLYRLHDQTVRVYIEETDDPFSAAPDIEPQSNVPEAIDNGDGTFQVKNVADGESMVVLPHAERIGDGLFMLTHNPGPGVRMRVERKG